MKKLIIFLLFCPFSFLCRAGIIVPDIRDSWTVPKSLYGQLFHIAMPDVAELYYTEIKEKVEKRNGKPFLVFIVGNKSFDSASFLVPVNYASFILAIIDQKLVRSYRLYYFNTLKQVYKSVEIDENSKPIRQLLMLDKEKGLYHESKFYKTGELFSESEITKSRKDREFSNWKIDQAIFYKDGSYKLFYPSGKIKATLIYRDNKLVDSSYTYYHQNGIVMSKFSTLNGKISDTAVFFSESGAMVKKLRYSNGIPVQTIFDKSSSDPHKKAFLYAVSNYDYKEAGKTYRYYANLNSKNDIELLQLALTIVKGFNVNNITVANDLTRDATLLAFKDYINRLQKGDKVYLHFSANSYHDSLTSGIGCSDVNKFLLYPGFKGFIDKNEIQKFIRDAQSKVGEDGQVVVAMDVCYSEGLNEDTGNKDKMGGGRGETSNFLLSLSNNQNIPLFIFSASKANEMAMEIIGEDQKSYGALSWALAQSFFNPVNNSAEEVFSNVTAILMEKAPRQHPGLLSKFDLPLFESSERKSFSKNARLPPIRQKGNVFAVSVGISDYSMTGKDMSFSNCANDAREYATFINSQFEDIKGERKITSHLLTDSGAGKKQILQVINDAISSTEPDDYFIFNFSGYCKPLADSTGKQVTWFVPYGLKNISDTSEIKKEGIPLTMLKDLLQMVPANNQLFITEAGSTESFQKEFIQALIETNPTIASLTNKNRIFIVPKSSGLDNFYCGGININHGPLNYYLTNLSSDLNIFGLFEGGIYAGALKYALTKNEVDCDYFKTSYFDIFFEKDYLKDLELFIPEGVALFRGGEMEEEIKKEQKDLNVKKYALVIGTDTYSGAGWGNLPNAMLDARRISEELKKGFDYEVMLLENKPADSIYEAIRQLSGKLQPNDQLIIYVSGHGDFDDKLMDDGYMVCSDSRAKKLDPYRNSYIAYSKLSRMINRLPAKQVLMVLDVCFGGTFDERAIRNKGRNDMYDDVATASYYSEKMKLKTRLYLSSGGKVAVPDGYAGKHSPFAHRLLQALQERGGAQKMLTSSNLFEFVKKLPSGPVLGSFGDDDLNTEFILTAR
jgi:antitoxin component YwqK of YwqJK toxin-antitoxin module